MILAETCMREMLDSYFGSFWRVGAGAHGRLWEIHIMFGIMAHHHHDKNA